MVAKQKLKIEPCFTFGDLVKNIYYGPSQLYDNVAFTPLPVDTTSVQVPNYFEGVRDKLAENMHEIWAMNKIEQAWKFADVRKTDKINTINHSFFKLIRRKINGFLGENKN